MKRENYVHDQLRCMQIRSATLSRVTNTRRAMIACVSFVLIHIACGSAAFGEDSHHHHHEAHQHGIGELGIVKDGKELSIVFRAPAADLVGFEHVAHTKEESEAVVHLEGALKHSEKLFVFPSDAGCKQVDHTLDHSLREEGSKKNGAKNGSAHAESSHSHTHSEVAAEYRLACENTEQLSSIELLLFREFPALKKIDASVVTPSYQGKQQLSPASSTLMFKQ